MVELVMILLLAVFSLWAAALLGLALGLSPLPLLIAVTVGYAISVVAMIALGAPLRDRLLARLGCSPRCDGRIERIAQRYGVIGLALVAPVLTGALVGAALGLSLCIPPRRLAVWMTGGAALWGVVLITSAVAGIA